MEKKYRKRKKIALFSVILLLVLFAAAIFLSPYSSQEGFSYKLVKHTVEIDAPIENVFQFLGNSRNASRWSVFVNHITTLNPDSFPDGAVGCRRRCFCMANESGTQWDELVTENTANTKRQLICYNLQDFRMSAEHLATEQLYETLGTHKCKLTFTLFFKDVRPTLWESMKMYIAAYQVKDVYERNMSNIKRIVEEERHE